MHHRHAQRGQGFEVALQRVLLQRGAGNAQPYEQAPGQRGLAVAQLHRRARQQRDEAAAGGVVQVYDGVVVGGVGGGHGREEAGEGEGPVDEGALGDGAQELRLDQDVEPRARPLGLEVAKNWRGQDDVP